MRTSRARVTARAAHRHDVDVRRRPLFSRNRAFRELSKHAARAPCARLCGASRDRARDAATSTRRARPDARRARGARRARVRSNDVFTGDASRDARG